ncbi:MAG: aminotransferase class V-fold PLP-dependent enzyme [Phycisphaeraceae bacterium]
MSDPTPQNAVSRRIYLDNAATSFPKPAAVHEAMFRYATLIGASPGRGAYAESKYAGSLLTQTRERLNQLINGSSPDHCIFTLNCSDALNIAIKGALRTGDHVITTDLDHNSILRPLNQLASDNVITQTRIACDPATGLADLDALRRAITPKTKLIATHHGSNVTGTVQDMREIGKIAREHDLLFLVDAAQTLGHLPLDVQADHIDLLAAPGHKGLLGPLGTGLLYIRPEIEKSLRTLREGGTGSVSESDTQPEFMPDRFEPGSHNTTGLVGLSQGVAYILDQTVDNVAKHEFELIDTFLAALAESDTPGLTLHGPKTRANRCGVFSFTLDGLAPDQLADELERTHNVLTRAGLHCAPRAHATIGTDKTGGTTRLSFGPFTTPEDVRHAAQALSKIALKQTTGV